MGPSERTGKNVSAPTIRITPINSTVNTGPVVGKVPALGGATFFFTLNSNEHV